MRMFAGLWLIIATASFLSSCGGSDTCTVGEKRACYSDSVETENVGPCRAGTQTCTEAGWGTCRGEVVPTNDVCGDGIDNDCDGELDNGESNACGGCTALANKVGDVCGKCGSFVCSGPENTVCQPPEHAIGEKCGNAPASGQCGSAYSCGKDGKMTCTAQVKNACGLCGGPAITNIGKPCLKGGCSGVYECSKDGRSAICNAKAPNPCGKCDGPPLADFGKACKTAAGCDGVNKCNAAGTGLECEGPAKNGCGLCGGPEVTGVGSLCNAIGSCSGNLTCTKDLKSAVCFSSGETNNCGKCGNNVPDVAGIGDPCTTAEGCTGTYACGDDGVSKVCAGIIKNACGVCGGPTINGVGTNCIASNGCVGKRECAPNGTGLVCRAPARNSCGVCGGPELSGVGASCLGSNGCAGTAVCNATGTGVSCDAPANCTNPLPACTFDPDYGSDCIGSSGCVGVWDCDASGLSIECNAPASCDVCSFETPGYGESCVNDAGCAGYNDCSGSMLTCVVSQSCPPLVDPTPTCNVTTPDYGVSCFDAGGCEGSYLCDDTWQTLICRAPGVGDQCEAYNGCLGLQLSCVNGAGQFDCIAAQDCSAHLVISEFAASSSHNIDDEFIELHNPGYSPVDASGVEIWYRPTTGSGSVILLATIPEGEVIPAGGYYLLTRERFFPFDGIEEQGYTGPVDGDLWFNQALSARAGSIWIMAPGNAMTAATAVNDPFVIDVLGYGAEANNAWEGFGTAPDPSAVTATDGSIERKAYADSDEASMSPGGIHERRANGQDSDDNGADFVLRTIRDPQRTRHDGLVEPR